MKDPILYGPPAGRGPLPLLVGIVGHGDLPGDDLSTLSRMVGKVLRQLARQHGSTPIVLLSGLAEGAERLAAQVALESGCRLIAVLPLPADVLARDCNSDQSRTEFLSLLQKAENVVVVPYVGKNNAENTAGPGPCRDQQYARAGAVLAEHCQILLALWDGAEADSQEKPTPVCVGGVGQVVQFCREGIAQPFAPAGRQLDPEARPAVYHLLTRRSSQAPGTRALTWNLGVTGRHRTRWRQMNGFNRDAVWLVWAEPHYRSRSALLSFGNLAQLPAALRTTIHALREWYAVADSLALFFQTLLGRATWLLFILAVATVYTVKVQANHPGEGWAKYGYTVLAGLAAGLGTLIGLLGIRLKYIMDRALAEGLRVQLFWRLAGLRDRSPDHYLGWIRRDLDWVPTALKTWLFLAECEEPASGASELGQDLALRCWVENQRNFFFARIPKLERQMFWQQVGYWSALVVGSFFLGLNILAMLEWLPNFWHWLADTWHLGPTWRRLLSLIDIFLALGLLGAAGFIRQFGRYRNLSTICARYRVMRRKFDEALQRLQALRNDPHRFQGALLELGRTALEENGAWVQLHHTQEDLGGQADLSDGTSTGPPGTL